MSIYLLNALKITIICLPLAVIATHCFRFRYSLRFAVLASLYVIITVNELMVMQYGDFFSTFHVLIDGICISVAGVFLIIQPRYGKATVPNEFVFHYGFLYLGMLGISALSLIAPENRAGLSAAEAFLILAFATVLYIQGRQPLGSIKPVLLVLWFASSCCTYLYSAFWAHLFDGVFFTVLCIAVLWNAYKDNSTMFYENLFLFKSRDTVLSMLNDISSSREYVTSVKKTLQRVLESVLEAMSVKGAAVYVHSVDQHKKPILKYLQSAGTYLPLSSDNSLPRNLKALSDTRLSKTHFKIGEGVVGKVAETHRPLTFSSTQDYHPMIAAGVNPRTIKNVLAVPFESKDYLKGVMIVENNNKAASFNESDIHLLQSLSEQAGVLLANTRMYMDLAKSQMFKQEADIARNIERQMLPKKVPSTPNLKVSVMIEPAREVGGDYYDFIHHDDGSLGIVIGDVSGKGVQAGMMVAIAKAILRLVGRMHHDPRQIMMLFRREIHQHILDRQFMTLNYMRWEAESRTLQFVGAGHEHLLWFHKSTGRAERIRAGGIAVGLVQNADELTLQKNLRMEDGDVVLLYTDGIIDARNRRNDLYGLQRLQTALATYAYMLDPKKIRDHIMKEVLDFVSGSEQYDDMILMVLSVVS